VALLTDLTDEQLLTQALAGDDDAFTVLYRRRQGPIFRFALHMSGSAQIAEEVTQEVFLFLLQRGGDFDAERGALGAFLFGVARNYVRRALERNYSEHVLGTPLEEEAAALMVESDPGEGIARRQTSVAVWKAVLSLPEHYREVVVLCDLQELSYADAAGTVGCAIGTIRSRLHRAHDMLSKKLQHSAAVAPSSKISNVAARCLS
jgi:RNA polymerase sigma-70 factor (ECF subfamily)